MTVLSKEKLMKHYRIKLQDEKIISEIILEHIKKEYITITKITDEFHSMNKNTAALFLYVFTIFSFLFGYYNRSNTQITFDPLSKYPP
jgi:hypothetical protein